MSTPGYDDPRKDHSGPAACQGSIVQIYYTRLIFTSGDELSYYKRNSWSSTDNGCEVTSNCSHGYAFEVKFILSYMSQVIFHSIEELFIFYLVLRHATYLIQNRRAEIAMTY
ncbi:unnamed protein product [Rotaria socialis]|uniref:Uncharacterized protein n=1 Tax=Rotaria socialis TaxID=392032 RepID=A0A821WYG1_9BILA|nr:unnamed protein product [Rotaria socialis]CAF3693576.1 unnamed protein product [Rotaria socialis]CAF4434913.1 unnamed protein product [Rotaria socialis]CAF4933022.1 unnamed protein product [Rotaria socialis]